MRTRASVFLTLFALVMLSGCAPPSSSHSGETPHPPTNATAPVEEIFTPVIGSVLATPIVTPMTDGRAHLAYELMLTNITGQPVTIDELTVTGDDTELLLLEHEALTPWIRPLGSPAPGRILSPGQQAIVTLDVAVASPEAAPSALSHTIKFSLEQAMPPLIEETMTQTIAHIALGEEQPVTIGSPVTGPQWLDGNSCCEVTPHRSAVNAINGALHAPERFAIDFVQLDAEGRIFSGPIDDLASYAFYGADILAVADGPIVSMEWSLPEETPGAHPVGLTLAQYGGNHIVQDIGDGRYAFYAHLQGGNPHGLSVGQEIQRGDVIGQLGNSGNTDLPHLHFHIMDSPLPLGSNGLPFLIDSFTFEGNVVNDSLMECMETPIPCIVEKPLSQQMQATSPLYRDLLTFTN